MRHIQGSDLITAKPGEHVSLCDLRCFGYKHPIKWEIHMPTEEAPVMGKFLCMEMFSKMCIERRCTKEASAWSFV